MTAIILNNRFDTDRPILDSLFDHAQKNRDDLPDHVFATACEEYNRKEDEVMQEMMNSDQYKFKRYKSGWTVKEKR